MTTALSIRDFKAICNTLRRFADVRETAKEPRDRVLIQTAAGRLKFIAGDEDMTVVVDAGEAEGRAKVVVGSRLLLKSAEALRGRGDIEIEVDRGAAFLLAPNGGKLKLSSLTTHVPEFVRPPKKSEAEAFVPHEGFAVAAKAFPAVTSKNHPADKVYLRGGRDNLTLTGCDDRSFAQWDIFPHPEYTVSRKNLGSVTANLFGSLVDMTEPGVLAWGDGRVAIRSGKALVGARLGGDSLPWPVPMVGDETVTAEVERKPLVDALSGMQGADEHRRVRLVISGEDLLVQNWEGNGNMSLLSSNTGRGSVGVDANRMKTLLNALPGKRVLIEFDGSRPAAVRLSTEEATGWQTLLAPVA